MRSGVIFVAVLSVMLAACTTVRIFKGNDIVEDRTLAIATNLPSEFHSLALLRRGMGVFVDGSGLVVGSLDERRIYVKDLDACRVVLFIENDEHLEKIRQQLCVANISLDEMCIISHQVMRKNCDGDKE